MVAGRALDSIYMDSKTMTDQNQYHDELNSASTPAIRQGRRPSGTPTVKLHAGLLRQARKSRGLSGEEMQGLIIQAGLQLSTATLYSLERGLTDPTPEVARLVGAVYGVPINDLIDDSPTAEPLPTDMTEQVMDLIEQHIRKLREEQNGGGK